jgi:hypothetical protein
VGVYRHSIGELHPTSVFHMKTQYVESLVVEVDIRYKPLLKVSELLLRHDDKPIGIPRGVWRWSGWSCRAVRSDGRLLRTSMRFGEPHRWASCGPYATEEKSIVPPRQCRVLLHTPRRLRNLVSPRRGCRWWLRRRWSLLLGAKTCSFLPWSQHSLPHK